MVAPRINFLQDQTQDQTTEVLRDREVLINEPDLSSAFAPVTR